MSYRITFMAVSVIAGVAIGYGAVLVLAMNLNVGTKFIPGIGYLHRVSLSQGPTPRSEIETFQLQATGVDDHMRIFLNNHVVLTTEDPCNLLGQERIPTDECKATRVNRYLVFPRISDNVYLNSQHLRKGVNHLVVELENDIYGYCGMHLGFEIDGVKPTNYITQTPVSPETVRALNEPWDNLSNSICSRRIYQFWLE